MEKMLFTTNGIGRLRMSAIETFKIDDDSLASSQIMTLPAKYRLVSEEIAEVIFGMIIKRVVTNATTTGTVPVPTGKIMDQGSKGRMCHPKIS
jgi:hypothetical protein